MKKTHTLLLALFLCLALIFPCALAEDAYAVSYTHLTLPTTSIV